MESVMPKPTKTESAFAARPANAAILKILAARRGATVAEIAAARKLQPHTVRSAISRLGSRGGADIVRQHVKGRGLVYKAVRS
jgi:predicted ArsR family transcriptional regulator